MNCHYSGLFSILIIAIQIGIFLMTALGGCMYFKLSHTTPSGNVII